MNYQEITLSSSSLSGFVILPEMLFYDKTSLSVSLSGISEDRIPSSAVLDWGDGQSEILMNDVYKHYTTDSIFPEILENKFTSIYTKRISHTYKPSEQSLYKSLTAEIGIIYPVNQILKFIIPITIRKNSFLEDFEDFDLTNTRFVDGIKREYHISSTKDDICIENVTDS
jgi:hypothetical protein